MKNLIRKKIIEASFLAGACHVGSALSCVEIVEAIMETKRRQDVFIFAKASGVAALYCYLHPLEKAWKYLKKYPLPSREVPGVNAGWSAGSLGMGLSVAAGMAFADRKRKVYCLVSDGELQEGQIWEALMFSGHHKLKNLVLIVDDNKYQSLGATKDIIDLKSIKNKMREFGWANIEVDGHDKERIKFVIKRYFNLGKQAKWGLCVVAHTVKGKGVSFCENDYRWHYRNLTEELRDKALLELK